MLHRAHVVDLEIRAAGDGRTVHGVVVPYDEPTTIDEGHRRYVETFTRGSFALGTFSPPQIARVKLLGLHDRKTMPLGKAVELRDDAHGLVGAFKLGRTAAADEALSLVTDGILDSFSIGFQPSPADRWSGNGSEVTRRNAILHEVSLVSFPAYAGAAVAGVRDATPRIPLAEARLRWALLKD